MLMKSEKELFDEIRDFLDTVDNMDDQERQANIILTRRFYDSMRESFTRHKVPYKCRYDILVQLLIYTVSYSTIAVRAYKPISGSGSIPEEVIKMNKNILQ